MSRSPRDRLLIECMALTPAEFTATPRTPDELAMFARVKANLKRVYPRSPKQQPDG